MSFEMWTSCKNCSLT